MQKKNDHFEINLISNKKPISIKSKILIGANGASSLIKGNNVSCKKYVAIQEWFKAKKAYPYFSAIFDKQITDFYSWTISKENYLIIGSAISLNSNADEKFNLLKNKLKKYDYIFDKVEKREGAIIYRPLKTGNTYIGNDNLAFIGEAAGFISPSSAEGLSYALKSALYMSKAINKNIDNYHEEYKKLITGIKINLMMKNFKSLFMYDDFLRKVIMKSGIQSLNIN